MDQDIHLKSLAKDKAISDHIMNYSRSMISIINRDYIYEKVNDTFCNAHNLNNTSVIGKSLSDVWGEKVFQEILKTNIDQCFSGQTISYEASFQTPKSGIRHFEVIFRPLATEGGSVTHLIAETFDIDELKRSQISLIEKEEELRKFETNLPIGFLRCDIKGIILDANKSFYKILQCRKEGTIIGENLKSFYVEEGLFEIQVEQLMANSTQSFGMLPLKNCRGDEIQCRISGFMGFDTSGNPSFIDLALENASREILLENRLLQAQKLETIGSLAGGIAHDFNNILATIAGYSELLIDDLSANSEASVKVSGIQMAVKRAQSIIGQMLTFSRQVEQVKIQISAPLVLRETIGFVKSALPHNIFIKSSIPRKEAIVYADPTQLFRIFLNLITNAAQSMEMEGGTISVSMGIADGITVQDQLNKDIVADEYVMISFRDTGKGMDKSHLNRIFEPFFTTREVGKGTGLGLSVVHGILSELEGEIIVSSKKGKGSVFTVYLPILKDFTQELSESGRGKKILFIAGNKHESRILSLALKNSGYELLYASDSRNLAKAISMKETQPDLIVYMNDSQLINTGDLVGMFQNININIPCILITDAILSQLEEKLLHSGIIRHHLMKPVSLKEILNAIQISLK